METGGKADEEPPEDADTKLLLDAKAEAADDTEEEMLKEADE